MNAPFLEFVAHLTRQSFAHPRGKTPAIPAQQRKTKS
jgi:hypothetical protein